jgi:hypothetical protein
MLKTDAVIAGARSASPFLHGNGVSFSTEDQIAGCRMNGDVRRSCCDDRSQDYPRRSDLRFSPAGRYPDVDREHAHIRTVAAINVTIVLAAEIYNRETQATAHGFNLMASESSCV